MFTGLYYHRIETKGRLAIPQAFRQELNSGGVITWGLDGCLFLFPNSYWNQLIEKLASLPLTSAKARDFIRLLVQQATPLELDAQGRTLIPAPLRDRVGLIKNVVVAGSLTRVEIWDQKKYGEHLELIAQDIHNAEDVLVELGI